MTLVAFLRGINVGGNNKVEMKKLKATFESLGLTHVRTYINSGNIIFDGTQHSANLVQKLEAAIHKDFGFSVKVLLRDHEQIKKVYQALPKSWVNDENMKCDIMFLWESVDNAKVLEQLSIKEGIDDVKYVAGTVLWRVDKKNVTRSGLMKLAGSPLYKQMTVRNCNTLRKLHELMSQ